MSKLIAVKKEERIQRSVLGKLAAVVITAFCMMTPLPAEADRHIYTLTTTPTPEPAQQETHTLGEEMGRLSIPDVGIDVALYYAGTQDDADTKQQIVDQHDSALWMDTTDSYKDGQPIIADHCDQAFASLRYVVANETIAYITLPDGSTNKYKCVDFMFGKNDEKFIYDNKGNDAGAQNKGGIAMYTCDDNWQNVILTYWQPLFVTKTIDLQEPKNVLPIVVTEPPVSSASS